MARFRDRASRIWRKLKAKLRDCRGALKWLISVTILFALPYLASVTVFAEWAGPIYVIRWAGMLLQLAGVYVVAKSLDQSLTLFKKPKLAMQFWHWLVDTFRVPEPKHVVGSPTSISVRAEISATGGFTSSTDDIQERLTRLEQSMQQARMDLTHLRREVSGQRREIERAMQSEMAERRKADRSLAEQLEAATIGGIHLSVAGLLYLALGIWCGTVPEETVDALRWTYLVLLAP